MTGTALVIWRKFPINPKKRRQTFRTICDVLRDLYRDAQARGDAVSSARIEDAYDMAKRMDRKLRSYAPRTPYIVSDSMRSIYIGFDSREAEAFAVCRNSLRRHCGDSIPIRAICLDDMREAGLYTRPTSKREGRLWDDISGAPMATEFAISRFLTPHLALQANRHRDDAGWALFMDCDILARCDVNELFKRADPSKAVMCVQHVHEPPEGVKMDGQLQTLYRRKNWSSVMLFNCGHPANARLTVDLVNTVPGRDLHRFCWLDDSEIGSLDPAWNFLVGHTDPSIDPKLVHFTEGGPWFEGYRDVPYAAEWVAERNAWARGEFQPIKEAA